MLFEVEGRDCFVAFLGLEIDCPQIVSLFLGIFLKHDHRMSKLILNFLKFSPAR